MKFAFRADASLRIGTGHVMRCLALAGALRKAGQDVHFMCRELPGHLCDFIAAQGFEVIRFPYPAGEASTHPGGAGRAEVPCAHADWLGVAPSLDISQTQAALARIGVVDWLVVDHYALDSGWESAMRCHAVRIMALDDLADRRHDVDLLLDQNRLPGQVNPYEGLLPAHCRVLLGPAYALLRPEFFAARHGLAERSGKVSRILVFFGGIDHTGETIKVLDALAEWQTGIQICIVSGAGNPRLADIHDRCRSLPNVTVDTEVADMASLMARADLCIGAGGVTAWERCCVGLPSLIVSVAANQDVVCGELAEAGAAIWLGTAANVTVDDYATALRFVSRLPDLLRNMSRKAGRLVDGQGVSRVLNQLLAPTIVMRKATIMDMEPVFAWRNSEEVRRHALNPGRLDWDDHQAWFRRVLADGDTHLLIAETGAEPVGVVRFDLEEGRARVSIFLSPARLGQSLGGPVLRAAMEWLRANCPSVRVITADILPDNKPSISMFTRAGFTEKYRRFERRLGPANFEESTAQGDTHD